MNLFSRLGPGILYAGAAVGTSHLIQSTRAGADYGFGLLIFFFLIALIKYPGIRFGSDFARASGKSLIHSYLSLGPWMAIAYTLMIFFSMAFVVAALSLVVTSVVVALIPLWAGPKGAVVVALLSALLLTNGKYRLLEGVNKFLVPLFTLLLVVVTVAVLLRTDWSGVNFAVPMLTGAVIIYLVNIAGWLLTPMDASVLMSLWSLEKAKQAESSPSDEEAQFDFNLGYWASLVLAICFLILGAGVLSNSEFEMPDSGGAFAAEVIGIFSGVLGDWSFPLVGLMALSIMFSTLLTVFDGYSRNLQTIAEIKLSEHARYYEFSVGVVTAITLIVLLFFMRSFASFIDLVGVLTFILGPVYALLNHRAMHSDLVPEALRPTPLMRCWSLAGIFVMLLVALAYAYFRWLA